MLITMGALGLLYAVKLGMSARSTAELFIKKADHDWKHGPPRWTKEDKMDKAAHGNEFISRDEFEMFDVLRNMSFCFFFICLNTLIMGKCGKRLVKNNEANLAKRMFKKAIFFMVFMSLVMFLNGNGKHMRQIIERNKTKHHHKERNLEEVEEFTPEEKEWDGRKEAYMMFAPKLWDKAKNEPSAQDEE